jgi:uridine kinase
MAEQLTVEQLIEFIQAQGKKGKRGMTLVAIDGPSGAGKTALSEALQASDLAATVVHVDDFYSKEGADPSSHLTPEEGCDEYVDWMALLELVIDPLVDGDPGFYQLYDWIAQKPDEWVTVEPRGVIVFEGVYAMRPQLRELYDVTVYVETPKDTRLDRLSKRSDNPAWVVRWAEAEEWYNTNIIPSGYADVIVSGS